MKGTLINGDVNYLCKQTKHGIFWY